MNLIKEVKERDDIVDVARAYGINVNRNNKALCCFHNEKTPSLSFHKEKQIFKCFSCGKGGDVISLVSELLNINALEAAKNINYNLCLGLYFNSPTPKYEVNRYKEKRKTEEAFKKWELETFILVTDYLRFLKNCIKFNDIENELYIKALHQIEYVDYIVDIFLNGTNEEKIYFWKHEKRWIKEIESEIRTFGAIRK